MPSIPIVATAVPKRPPAGAPSIMIPLARPTMKLDTSAIAIVNTGSTVDSMPTESPMMMFVAGPVCEASAIESTGR